MFGKKADKSAYGVYELNILEAAEKLSAGDEHALRLTYEAFATQNEELVRTAGRAIAEYLRGRNTKQMIRISEQFREFTSLDWFIDWKAVDMKSKREWFETESEYRAALLLGTFHPNGYFREQCLKHLEEYADTLVYLMLRTNDWVERIRQAAYQLTLQKLKQCSLTELVPAILVLEKLRQSGRIAGEYFREIEKQFYERMEMALKQVPLEKIRFCEFDAKKYIYRLLVTRQILTRQQIENLLEYEKHDFCKQILIVGILQYYPCSAEQVEGYLSNRSGVVRRRALEHKYSLVKDAWQGLEDMLLDKNKGVREMTAFVLQKHTNFSVLDFYIEHLQDENPIPAIIGVGEHGGKAEGKRLLPFLNTDSEKILRAALEMLGRTIGIDGYDIYLNYLQAENAGVSKSAFKAIQHADIRYGCEEIYELAVTTPHLHTRKYALRLLMQRNSWKRLPYLLKLYGKEAFFEHKNDIYAGMWCRDMYGSISVTEAQDIQNLLQEHKAELPEILVKNILFDLKFVVKK